MGSMARSGELQQGLAARVRQSYVASGLRRPEHWISAAVAVVVGAVVMVLAQRPIERGSSIDLASRDHHGLAEQITVVGFGWPDESGRKVVGRDSRLVWNRRLPEQFVLEIEGRSQEVARTVEVAIGTARHEVRFEIQGQVHSIPISNPEAERSVGFRSLEKLPGSVALRRVTVR